MDGFSDSGMVALDVTLSPADRFALCLGPLLWPGERSCLVTSRRRGFISAAHVSACALHRVRCCRGPLGTVTRRSRHWRVAASLDETDLIFIDDESDASRAQLASLDVISLACWVCG